MNWSIKFISGPNLFLVTLKGIFSIAATRKLFAELTTHTGWLPGSPILFDQCKLKNKEIQTSDLEELADLFKEYEEHFRSSRIAMLCGNNLQFGLNRQIQTLCESRTAADIAVFRIEEEALNWLNSEQ
jgi:hypothetical protein